MANAALGPDSPSCCISLFREASIRSEATIGKSITSAAERAESATLSPLHFIFMMRKRRVFARSTQSEPPNTPVYSYHCIMESDVAKEFPKTSQGQETCQLK